MPFGVECGILVSRPFEIHGFRADNGSEHVNHEAATLPRAITAIAQLLVNRSE
ncbi:MAG: hypothetical protein ABI589_07325 [Burkholderiales bacterium]